jgi:hypothetical protein
VIATDAEADLSPFGFSIGRYAEAERLSALEAVARYPDRAVFCSWPSPGEAWATEMVRALPLGQSIALVLHERIATTGDAALVETLAEFDLLLTVQLPQFPQVSDRLLIYRKS